MSSQGQQLRLETAARLAARSDAPETLRTAAVRRRETALRLAELDGIACDPDVDWDEAPNPRRLTVELGSKPNTAWIRGRAAVRIMDSVGSPRLWDYEARTWSFPRRLLNDLCAAADHGHIPIRIRLVDR